MFEVLKDCVSLRMKRIGARMRYQLRNRRAVSFIVYTAGNLWHATLDSARASMQPVDTTVQATNGRLALCLRFRDEGRYLEEWLEYYIAAGVDHFYLYNNYSCDEYYKILQPYMEKELVTLIDWPHSPASPGAEDDCIARTRGHFEWVGFIDADEFVVVRDGRSIKEFLAGFPHAPGVALHWYVYGSDGHRERPANWVIEAYQRRASIPNDHFKVFVRPERVTANRNSHNFFYKRACCAVDENHRAVYASLGSRGTADQAWINHYYVKSLSDYLDKARRLSTLDAYGMRAPSRREATAEDALGRDNEVFDPAAANYYKERLMKRQALAGMSV